MAQKIRVSKEAVGAFEEEVKLALENSSRTLKDVSNKEVRLILDNPGCEIEVYDAATKKTITTIAAGGGVLALAASETAALVGVGAAATGGGAAISGFTAASAAVPGIGWIIAGGILAVTAGTATVIAIKQRKDIKKAKEDFNRKQTLYQNSVRKMYEELSERKKNDQKNTERLRYLEAILAWLMPSNPGESPFATA